MSVRFSTASIAFMWRRVQKLECVWSKYSKAQRVSSLHLPNGQRSIQKALFAASHPVDEFGYPRPTAVVRKKEDRVPLDRLFAEHN